ncbi:ankyrin repeat domain-containing protein [Pseudomonas sp. GD03858]|uniref:ankyrin repeat domain-containing protein n=1 Tax=unclassified Pseudomonas TaxID=196821 RepID=UPI00244D45F3|nr:MULTISPECIES: ankyrin repeat domain-containing protein [unclassified Pseudomonas]MDH0646900.1 ankyrin repeat domain-containing protein [Pseudomonas sp. GD03867]MDH0663917.1 ankyrin repeat domain-containing protein [Pseudomonas sp. GD03858]
MHAWILAALIGLTTMAAQAHALPAAEGQGAAVEQRLRDYFFDAARRGDETMLATFIQAGYDLNVHDDKGYTGLILAAYHGQRGAVEQLLGAGADPCAQDLRGNTALMGAIFKGEVRIAQRLIGARCNLDQRNANGQTAAMYAALFQREALLDRLLLQGADPRAQDALGNTVRSLQRGQLNGVSDR